MIVCIDNGLCHSDHCIFFVDLGMLSGHTYDMKDVECVIKACTDDEECYIRPSVLFTSPRIDWRKRNDCMPFSTFAFTALMRFRDDGLTVPLTKIESADLCERLKADFKVEIRKYCEDHKYQYEIKVLD